MTKETLKRAVKEERYEEIMKDIKFHYKQGFKETRLRTRFAESMRKRLISDGFEIKNINLMCDKYDDNKPIDDYEEFTIVFD